MGIHQATEEQFDQLCKAIERSNADLGQAMPDEAATLHLMYAAHQRLRAFGWREIRSCPKDGTPFQVIEPDSSGIHYCTFDTHAKGQTTPYWISDAGDLWPARPIFWRPLPAENNANSPSNASAGNPATDDPNTSPPQTQETQG